MKSNLQLKWSNLESQCLLKFKIKQGNLLFLLLVLCFRSFQFFDNLNLTHRNKKYLRKIQELSKKILLKNTTTCWFRNIFEYSILNTIFFVSTRGLNRVFSGNWSVISECNFISFPPNQITFIAIIFVQTFLGIYYFSDLSGFSAFEFSDRPNSQMREKVPSHPRYVKMVPWQLSLSLVFKHH